MSRLSAPQLNLLERARDHASLSDYSARMGTLVSGPKYRTALSLERRGFGRVQYQGPSLGWFIVDPIEGETCGRCGRERADWPLDRNYACAPAGWVRRIR